MIETFKNKPMRGSGKIFSSSFEKIKDLYSQDRDAAGELAISFIEFALTGEISTDNALLRMLVEDTTAEKNRRKIAYDDKKIEKYRLREIAQYLKEGLTQKEIAYEIGVSTQVINYRINKMIAPHFAFLLQK